MNAIIMEHRCQQNQLYHSSQETYEYQDYITNRVSAKLAALYINDRLVMMKTFYQSLDGM